MKRDELRKILRDYMEKNGAMEFLWTVDDELFRPVIHNKSHQMILATGDFRGNFDYGRGLMVVSINIYLEIIDGKPLCPVSMSIRNIDDGIWRATSKNFDTKEEAQELADKVARELVKTFGKKLPHEDDLNEFLRQFGMYGHFEG